MSAIRYEQEIVIDLEFTPTDKDLCAKGLESEVIQIGAVRLDPEGRTVDSFSCYVKPDYIGQVAYHVKKLTGIDESCIVEAPSFPEAMQQLEDWIGSQRSRIVAWSDSDKRQIEAECAVKGLRMPYQMKRWLDLQKVYPKLMEIQGPRKRMSLKVAAQWAGIDVDSSKEHSALYDAEITAELMRQLLAGEYREQKDALAKVMPQRAEDAGCGTGATVSLGSKCSGLADLYRALMAEAAPA